MKKTGFALLLLLIPSFLTAMATAGPKPRQKEEGLASPSIEKVEISSLSRDRASLWVRAVLPRAAKGWKQTFSGEVRAWGVPLKLDRPVTVAVQPRSGGFDAVFSLELELAKLPGDLVLKAGGGFINAEIRGTLTGEGGSRESIEVTGSLRAGTPQIEAPGLDQRNFFVFSGGKLSNLSLEQSDGEVQISLFNPLTADLGVKELRYTLAIEGNTLAQGSRTGIKLYGRRDNRISIPVTVKHSSLAAAAGTTVRNRGTIGATLSGSLILKTATDSVTLNFVSAGNLQLVP